MERRVGKVFRDSRVRMKCRANFRMKGFEVHDCGCLEYQRIEYGLLFDMIFSNFIITERNEI